MTSLHLSSEQWLWGCRDPAPLGHTSSLPPNICPRPRRPSHPGSVTHASGILALPPGVGLERGVYPPPFSTRGRCFIHTRCRRAGSGAGPGPGGAPGGRRGAARPQEAAISGSQWGRRAVTRRIGQISARGSPGPADTKGGRVTSAGAAATGTARPGDSSALRTGRPRTCPSRGSGTAVPPPSLGSGTGLRRRPALPAPPAAPGDARSAPRPGVRA